MEPQCHETPPHKKKSCLVSFLIFFLILGSIFLIVRLIVNNTNNNRGNEGTSYNSSSPTLTSRKATTNDIHIESDDSNLVSIELLLTPKKDIDDLEITVEYYDKNKTLLKTKVVYYGDVKEGATYSKSISISNFSLSEFFKLSYARYLVTGGTVSYFQ